MPPRRVSLFVTCLVDLLYPEVAEAAVALLEAGGLEVDVPAGQTCCGQPAYNSGFDHDARRVAVGLIDALEDAETIVSPSGSCTAMLRVSYPQLFKGTKDQARAEALAAKTFELTEFLVDVMGQADDRSGASTGGRFEGRATFPDSCHGLRELGLTGQGRKLLSAIEGLELVEMDRPEMCCGFGGTFSVRLPDVATAMADDKVAQAAAVEADLLVAGDAGCLMHLAGRLSRTGSGIRPVHVATVLAGARGLVPATATTVRKATSATTPTGQGPA
jgi:L-lactate dehydrogenase complex protein LldE